MSKVYFDRNVFADLCELRRGIVHQPLLKDVDEEFGIAVSLYTLDWEGELLDHALQEIE